MTKARAYRACRVLSLLAAAGVASTLSASPSTAMAKTPEEVFDTAPVEEEYFDLAPTTRPSDIRVTLPAVWRNKSVTVYWQWSGKREVSTGTLRWTQGHPGVEDMPGVPGYGQLAGTFKARLDSSPTLRISAPYRSRIDLCWNVDIVVVDRQGRMKRTFVVPHSSPFDPAKANRLVDVRVWTS